MDDGDLMRKFIALLFLSLPRKSWKRSSNVFDVFVDKTLGNTPTRKKITNNGYPCKNLGFQAKFHVSNTILYILLRPFSIKNECLSQRCPIDSKMDKSVLGLVCHLVSQIEVTTKTNII